MIAKILKNHELQPQSFFRSQEHFFLTAHQKIFGNKIPIFFIANCNHGNWYLCQLCHARKLLAGRDLIKGNFLLHFSSKAQFIYQDNTTLANI